MIIGLSGKGGVGKTTFADIAVRDFGFEKRSFATAVKLEVEEFLKRVGIPFEQRNLYGHLEDKEEVCDIRMARFDLCRTEDQLFTRECFGHGMTFRKILQWWGTDFRRVHFGIDYWTRKAMQDITLESRVIFDDVRFPNEYDAIMYNPRGMMIRIERPNRPKMSNPHHPSETSLDHHMFCRYFVNTGTLEEYQERVTFGLVSVIEALKGDNFETYTSVG